VPLLFDKEKWSKAFGKELTPILGDALHAGGIDVYPDFEVDTPRANDSLRNAYNRITTIPGNRWDDLRESLTEGITAGETVRELRDRVQIFQDRDVSETAEDGSRRLSGAERIARTETSGAYNTGHYEGGVQNPDIVGGEWIGTPDDRIRESHAEVSGERRLIGETFSNGLLYPGEAGAPEEEVINCRCTYAPLDAEEMAA
jgi:hypothetical protein